MTELALFEEVWLERLDIIKVEVGLDKPRSGEAMADLGSCRNRNTDPLVPSSLEDRIANHTLPFHPAPINPFNAVRHCVVSSTCTPGQQNHVFRAQCGQHHLPAERHVHNSCKTLHQMPTSRSDQESGFLACRRCRDLDERALAWLEERFLFRLEERPLFRLELPLSLAFEVASASSRNA